MVRRPMIWGLVALVLLGSALAGCRRVQEEEASIVPTQDEVEMAALSGEYRQLITEALSDVPGPGGALDPADDIKFYERPPEEWGTKFSDWAHLANVQRHFGRYEEALAMLERARELSMPECDVEDQVERISWERQRHERFASHIPEEHVVVDVDELAVGGGRTLLCAFTALPVDWAGIGRCAYGRPTVTVLRTQREEPDFVYRSAELVAPRFGPGNAFIELGQTPVPPDGRRPPALIVALQGLGASWQPAHVKVLEWRGEELVEALGVDSSAETGVKDLNGDGVPEIKNYFGVGLQGCHGNESGWEDVYGWADGRWGLVSDRFPEEFEERVRDLRYDLKKFPKDPERWYYLGVALEITGQSDEALEAYRKSILMFEALIAEDEANGWPEHAESARKTRDEAIRRAEALAAAE